MQNVDPLTKFSVDPEIPAWVEPRPAAVDPGSSGEPVHIMLSDDQIDVGSAASYRHVIQRLNNSQGVQQASQIEIPFDPQSQELTIHSIAVIRGGIRREVATDASVFRMIQRETNLERQIYDGTISAVMLIEDVRVGDILDVRHTIVEHDAVFPGQYATLLPLELPVAIDATYLTVRGAPGVMVEVTGGSQLQRSEEDGVEVWRLARGKTSALELDPAVPSRILQTPYVQISDFTSWENVSSLTAARWDKVINATNDTAEMDALVESSDASPEVVADTLISFVQNEIRYLGLEGGINSLIPESPSRVFGRRFGDCKDTSLLLCHLFGRVGIPSCPVLVNSEFEGAFDTMLPSPRVFNHVIVMYEIADQLHFVDPTLSGQGGKTGTRYVPPYGLGLPIRASGGDLIAIPKPTADSGELEVIEEFVIGKGTMPTQLAVQTTALGFEADVLRDALGTRGESGAEKFIENMYQDIYPGAKRVGVLKSEDDRVGNRLVIHETFTIPNLVQSIQGMGKIYGVVAQHINLRLVGAPEKVRSQPLGLPFPNHVRQIVKMVPPRKTVMKTEKENISSPAFSFSYAVKPYKGGVQLEYQYKNHDSEVSASDYENYMTKLERVAGSTAYGIPAGKSIHPLLILVLSLMVGVVVGLVRSCYEKNRTGSDPTPAIQENLDRATSITRSGLEPGGTPR